MGSNVNVYGGASRAPQDCRPSMRQKGLGGGVSMRPTGHSQPCSTCETVGRGSSGCSTLRQQWLFLQHTTLQPHSKQLAALC